MVPSEPASSDPNRPLYHDFYYPLNVFMHILTHEEGAVTYLHYGLFASPDERIADAQERSTQLLLDRLPAPPSKLLEVGIGIGTTLARLTRLGYDVQGITPDAQQIAMVHRLHGQSVRAHCAAFESFDTPDRFDLLVFQESSQYIDSETLFARAATLADDILVIDEFALEPLDAPGLHALDGFLAAAERHGYRVTEQVDLSQQAAPTMAYFESRIPEYRERLIHDLGLTDAQIDDLLTSGARYRDLYARGIYGYRLLRFQRGG
jgi:hypothetical protein